MEITGKEDALKNESKDNIRKTQPLETASAKNINENST
jgi:hypothetical protein